MDGVKRIPSFCASSVLWQAAMALTKHDRDRTPSMIVVRALSSLRKVDVPMLVLPGGRGPRICLHVGVRGRVFMPDTIPCVRNRCSRTIRTVL